ncbi:OmpP1/FadL family transporter [Vibrio rumoiensis]|uniref:Aromatic hydrocarbon degradation protein n=1 Tax=Vibrio rumoiensis 1S-45 TaxID=1188252 RepID=A0A1E5E3M7_9VIBR|nr:outer membrane protein transport protein [Vibrio rumoiensis]OEF26945.1 hypothetical protein A1QC_00840 [Vibrio rumoiensis 1S-45]
MMLKYKRSLLFCALLPMMVAPAMGAGYQFSRFNYSNLYNKDDKVTLAYSWFNYDVEGQAPNGQKTGNLADDTHYIQGGVNYHFTDNFSGNIQYYRAHNINTEHTQGVYEGSGAFVRSRVLAFTGKYQFNPYFSAFLGPTINDTEIQADFDGALTRNRGNLNLDLGQDYALGYTAGASFHYPDIALRATLGYQSEIKHDFDDIQETGSLTRGATLTSQGEIVLPQSVTFDFQTGIAPKTLLTFNAFWTNWKAHTIDSQVLGQVVGFKNNTMNYSLGVAYQFTPQFVGLTELLYGEGAGEKGVVNPLAPANGSKGVKVAGRYKFDDFAVFMQARYTMINDGTDRPTQSTYEGNSVVILSAGVEYLF